MMRLIFVMICFLSAMYAKNYKIAGDELSIRGAEVISEVASKVDVNATYSSVKTDGTYESYRMLKSGDADFAYIRGDLLSNLTLGVNGFEKDINIGVIYKIRKGYLLLGTKSTEIPSIGNMEGMQVSTGDVENLSQVLLDQVAHSAGIGPTLDYKAFNKQESVRQLMDGVIDALFVYGNFDDVGAMRRAGVVLNNIPNDFLPTIKQHQGLRKILVVREGVQFVTYGSDFYLMARNDLDIKAMSDLMEVLVRAGTEIAESVPANIGLLHPLLGQTKAAAEAETELQNKLEEKKCELKNAEMCAQALQNLAPIKVEPIEELFFESAKRNAYLLTNQSDQNLTYTFAETESTSFDTLPIKPRHVFDVVQRHFKIEAGMKKVLVVNYKELLPSLMKFSGNFIFVESYGKAELKVPFSADKTPPPEEELKAKGDGGLVSKVKSVVGGAQ